MQQNYPQSVGGSVQINGLGIFKTGGDDGCGESRRAKAQGDNGQYSFLHGTPGNEVLTRTAESSIPEPLRQPEIGLQLHAC